MGKYLDLLKQKAKEEEPSFIDMLPLVSPDLLLTTPSELQRIERAHRSRKAAANYTRSLKESSSEDSGLTDREKRINALRSWRSLAGQIKNSSRGFFDPNMTDAYLAEHVGELETVFQPLKRTKEQWDVLFSTMTAEGDLSAEEADALRLTLGDDLQKASDLYSGLLFRTELLVSPSYQGLETTNLSEQQKDSILRTEKPSVFTNELKQFIRDSDEAEKKKAEEALFRQFPLPVGFTDSGEPLRNSIADLLNRGGTLYIRNGNQEDWYRVTILPGGKYAPQKMSAEESRRTDYRMRTLFPEACSNDVSHVQQNDASLYSYFKESLKDADESFLLNGDEAEYINNHPLNEEKLKEQLLKGVPAFSKGKGGGLRRIRMTDSGLSVTELSPSEYELIQATSLYRKVQKIADRREGQPVPEAISSLLPACVFSGKIPMEPADQMIDRLGKELSKNTSWGRSSDNYRMVQTAIRTYQEQAGTLDTAERIRMLRNISSLARNYIEKKVPDLSTSSYTRNRILAMSKIESETKDMADALSILREEGYHSVPTEPAILSRRQLETRLKDFRNALASQPFRKENYAYIKAVSQLLDNAPVSAAQLSAKVEEFQSSPELNKMEEHLTGRILEEKSLDGCFQVSKAFFKTAESMENASELKLINFYEKQRDESALDLVAADYDFFRAIRNDSISLVKGHLTEQGYQFTEEGVPVPQKSIQNSNIANRSTQSGRLDLIRSLPDKTREAANSALDNDLAAENAKAELFRSFFGLSVKATDALLSNIDKSAFSERQRSYYVVVSYLLEKGLSIDDILDPHARLSEKRTYGDELKKRIQDAVAKQKEMDPKKPGPDPVKVLQNELYRKNMDAVPAIQNYIHEKIDELDPEDSVQLRHYAETADILQDGMWDVICQFQVQSTTWDPAHRAESAAIYAKPDEPVDKTLYRVMHSFNIANQSRMVLKAKKSLAENKAAIIRRLVMSDRKVGRSDDLQATIKKAFQETVFSEAIAQLAIPDDPAESDNHFMKILALRSKMTPLFGELIYPALGGDTASLLFTDPELSGRLQVDLNSDVFRMYSQYDLIENGIDDITPRFAQFAGFRLRFDDGTDYTLSKHFIVGEPTPEDVTALNRFSSELTEYKNRRLEEGKKLRDQDRQEALNQLAGPVERPVPDVLRAVGDLYNNVPSAWDDILQIFSSARYHEVYTDQAEDTLERIIVGGKTLNALLNDLVQKENIPDSSLSGQGKDLLAAGILITALSRGVKVERGSHRVPALDGVGQPYTFETIELPEDLLHPSEQVSKALSTIWDRLPDHDLLPDARKGPDPGHEQAKIDESNKWQKQLLDKVYSADPEIRKNLPLSPDHINRLADNSQVFSREIRTLTDGASDYVFANGRKLSPETVILTLAYAKAFDAKNHEEKASRLNGKEHLPAEIKDKHVREAFVAAASEYRSISSLPQEEADRAMRVAVMKCLRFIGSRKLGADVPSGSLTSEQYGLYVENNLIRLKAQEELLDLVNNDRTPAGLGLDRNQTLGKLLEKDPVSAAGDLAAMQYLKYAETIRDMISGKDIQASVRSARTNLYNLTALKGAGTKIGNETPLTIKQSSALFSLAEKIQKPIRLELSSRMPSSLSIDCFADLLKAIKDFSENNTDCVMKALKEVQGDYKLPESEAPIRGSVQENKIPEEGAIMI